MHSESENIDNSNTNVVADSSTNETNHEEKQSFVSQVEAAFAKHLPEGDGIDALVKQIVSAYLDSPPPQKYDDDFFFDIIKPVMAQIIEVRDILEKDIRIFNEFVSNNDTDKALSFARKALEGGSDNLKDILEFYDVVPYKIADNKFQPLKQTAFKYVKTDDESLLKIVLESLSSGYERKGKVVRKERVTAYSVEKNAQKGI